MHFPGDVNVAKKQWPAWPWLCALPLRAGCGAALACAMAAAIPGCVAGWTLAESPSTSVPSPRHRGPHRHLGERSRNGSSQGCWRLIPQRIYQQGLEGADSLRASAKLQAPARARPGTRAAAISGQQLPSCVQGSPRESQCPTQSQSHHQGLPFGASWMLSANYVAHSSPLGADDKSQGENACFSAAVEDPKDLFPQGALESSAREIVEESPWGSSLNGYPAPSLRKMPRGALDQSPQIPVLW